MNMPVVIGFMQKPRVRWCYRTNAWRQGLMRLADCSECGKAFIGGYGNERCGECRTLIRKARERFTGAALRAVARAVALGELASPSSLGCVDCGGAAHEYEHRDYTRPLDVEPTCRKCNRLRGPGAPFVHLLRARPVLSAEARS